MEIKDFQDTEKLRFSRVCNAEFRFAQFRGTMEKADESPDRSINMASCKPIYEPGEDSTLLETYVRRYSKKHVFYIFI